MKPFSATRIIPAVLFSLAIFCALYYVVNKEKNPPIPPLHAEQIRDGIKEFLGKGYRGYQYYASTKSCTLPLFNLIDEEHVDVQPGTSWEGRFATGETKTEFYDSYFGEASASGSYGAFSGEITASFSGSTLKNRAHSFATANNTITYYRLTLLDSVPLKKQVEEDLMEMDPEKLFDTYGTHYLRSIYIGGRVNFSSYVDRTKVTKDFQMQAAMKASYGENVSGSASGGTTSKSDVEQVSTNKTIKVDGGDPALAAMIVNGVGEPSENYAKWSQSIPKNMSISDIADKGMIPLYELVEDPDRKAILEEAWIAYMEANTADVLKEGEPVVIKKDDAFLAQEADGGRFIGEAPYYLTYIYYYPTIADEAMTLSFDSGSAELEDKNNILIKTSETFDGAWKDRIYLGAFADKNNLYYWVTYDAKTNWIIQRIIPGADKRIRYGDQVTIKNEEYEEYLAPTKNGLLSTQDDPFIWSLLPAP